jgi:hypothetical protein
MSIIADLIVSSLQTNAHAAHQQRMKALVASGYKPDDSETTVVSDVELDDADFQ